MAPAVPPDYGTVQYWDKKYLDNNESFDWLLPPCDLDDIVFKLLESRSGDSSVPPWILHIGSGTSTMSFSLLKHVNNASQIYNIDYSQTAIEWGKSMELELLRSQNKDKGEMGWIQASLLHLSEVRSIGKPGSFTLIVDKCTADSIACGDDVMTSHPFPYYASSCEAKLDGAYGIDHAQRSDQGLLPIHPLQVLCIHLALLTSPGAVWLAVSYSAHRFDFLNPDAFDDFGQDRGDFPHPRTFWEVESREAVEVNSPNQDSPDSQFVHRPKTEHYLFILRRTDSILLPRSKFC